MPTVVDSAVVAFLAVAAFVASFIDSQVGGGGVISLPALLAVVPGGTLPAAALGTNKLAGTGSSLVATLNYGRSGLIGLRPAVWLMPLSFVGAVAGTLAVQKAPSTFVIPVVLVVMLAMTVYVLVKPRFGVFDREQPATRVQLGLMAACALGIGFYDGFLGPGTGSMLLFAIVTLLGMGFQKAAALGRLLNFASNASALAIFLATGNILWDAGIVMLMGMLAGSYVGSHVSLKHGDRYLKPLFVGMTGVLLVRLLGKALTWW